MDSSPLLSKPSYVSQFNNIYHADYEVAAAKRIREYFGSRWPWTSEKQKETYTQDDAELLILMACFRSTEDRNEAGATHLVFYFAFDDFLETVTPDRAIKAVEGMKRVLLDNHPPQNTLENIMHDIRSRMLSFGDERSRELANYAFTQNIKYLEANVKRAERCQVLEQGMDSYLKYRHHEAGFWYSIAIYAWELDLSPPPKHIQEDSDFNMLFSVAADQMVLINDMYSYRREALGLGVKAQREGTTGENTAFQDAKDYFVFNVVCILLDQDGVDETNAMDRLGTIIHGKESEYIAIAQKLRLRYNSTADMDLIEKWVEILTEWMAINHYWSTICRRYNQLDIFDD